MVEPAEGYEVKILLADAEDAEVLLAVQKLAFLQEAARYDAYSMPPLTETVDDVREAFEKSTFLKAVAGKRVVGVVRATPEGGTCVIGRLAVHPDFQDEGIGTALLREAEARCGDASRLELFVGSRSDKNIHIYQKQGYRTFKAQDIRDDVQLLYMEKLRK